jgi:hypothetical protein
MLLYQFAGPGVAGNTYTTTTTFDALRWRADAGAGVGYSFLTAAAPIAPNTGALPHPPLRVSSNGNLAVEAADLTRRQPRHFFANPALLDGWNRTLTRLGSHFQLFPEPNATVTFTLPAGGAAQTLVRIRPANLSTRTAGDQMEMTENCDVAVTTVTGSFGELVPVFGQPVFLGTTPAQALYFDYFAANSLTGGHLPATDLPAAAPGLPNAQDAIAQNYGTSVRALALGAPVPHNPNLLADLQATGVNQFARPVRIGQGLYTGSLGPRTAAPAGGFQLQDYANARVLMHAVSLNQVVWGFHWGGVIAMDGTDFITLENYARAAEVSPAAGAAPPAGRLFYFQMYGAGAGETWHEQWEPPAPQGKGFANGITMLVEPPAQTGMQYFNAGSKNGHAAVGAAANLAQLQGALVDGLNYANMHLHAPGLPDQIANRARLLAWRQQVANYLANPPGFAAGPQITALANHVAASLNAVTPGL